MKKTAIKLLKQYGSVEGIYEHIDEMKQSKMKENLINDKDQAFLSKELATINTQAPVEISIDSLKYEGKDLDKLVPFYKEMEFKQFLSKLAIVEEETPMTDILFEVVHEFHEDMFTTDMALYVEMMGDNYHTEDIVGVAWGTKEKIYVTNDLAIFENESFYSWLADPTRLKKVYDAKRTYVALNRYTTKTKGIDFDVLLGAYLLDTNEKSTDIEGIAAHYGYHEVQSDEAVYGKGAKKGLPEDEEVFFAHLARKVSAINVLTPQLTKELAEKNQEDLFRKMELPLSIILAEMEISGIKVDATRLQEMKVEFSDRLREIEQKIYQEAGEEFNLNSPKQLGVILFEKMGLPVIKKKRKQVIPQPSMYWNN